MNMVEWYTLWIDTFIEHGVWDEVLRLKWLRLRELEKGI